MKTKIGKGAYYYEFCYSWFSPFLCQQHENADEMGTETVQKRLYC